MVLGNVIDRDTDLASDEWGLELITIPESLFIVGPNRPCKEIQMYKRSGSGTAYVCTAAMCVTATVLNTDWLVSAVATTATSLRCTNLNQLGFKSTLAGGTCILIMWRN
jgi:hypothetical protein